ncbi:MAG: hypothetical protein EA363_13390 [Balneolaceae bacterium]|nr:MAG: hypothetical protein EA363_13390 [Balneolaceae bacterium]
MKLRKSILLTLLAGVAVLTGTAAMPAAANSGAGGFVRQLGADWLTGNDGSTLRLNLTLGYQYTDRFSAGIGAGYAFYNDPVDLVPIYLDLTYLLGDGSNAAFLQLKSGFSRSVMRGDEHNSVRHRGGLFIQPGVGIRMNDMSITAGFSFDHASWDQEEFFGRLVREKVSFRRIQLGVGFHF